MNINNKNKNVFYFIYEMKNKYGDFVEVSKRVNE